MKRLYGFIASLYLNNVLVVALDIFIAIKAGEVMARDKEIINLPMPGYYTIVFLVFGIWFLLFAVMSLVNIVNAMEKFIKKDFVLLEKYVKTVKLGLLPFWAINCAGYTALVVMANIPSHGFGIFIAPLPVMASYCVLLITSVYSILFFLLWFQNSTLTNKQILIYAIAQFCFVLDIAAILYFLRKKRTMKAEHFQEG